MQWMKARRATFYQSGHENNFESFSLPIMPYASIKIERSGAVICVPSRKGALPIHLSRRLSKVEMAAICLAANSQQRSVLVWDSVGDESHDESDSRLIGPIWIRAVNDIAVMQRHLARLQYNIYCMGFINRLDSLTAK